MDIKVIKRYVDKHSLEMIEAGKVLKNVPDDRAKELISEGVAELAPMPFKKTAVKKK